MLKQPLPPVALKLSEWSLAELSGVNIYFSGGMVMVMGIGDWGLGIGRYIAKRFVYQGLAIYTHKTAIDTVPRPPVFKLKQNAQLRFQWF